MPLDTKYEDFRRSMPPPNPRTDQYYYDLGYNHVLELLEEHEFEDVFARVSNPYHGDSPQSERFLEGVNDAIHHKQNERA